MKTIEDYLNHLFESLPHTKEVREIKAELLNNMEEKYQELKTEGKSENEAIGIVIAEFGSIDELMQELGIEKKENKLMRNPSIQLSRDDVTAYISMQRKVHFMTGLGVAAILFGVSLLILISSIADKISMLGFIKGDFLDTLSVIPLFILIALAVGLFIYGGNLEESYSFLKKGNYVFNEMTREFLQESYLTAKRVENMMVMVGVVLCVLSVVPIFIGSMFGDLGSSIGVSMMFIIIGAAVFCFIFFGSDTDVYKRLLKRTMR